MLSLRKDKWKKGCGWNWNGIVDNSLEAVHMYICFLCMVARERSYICGCLAPKKVRNTLLSLAAGYGSEMRSNDEVPTRFSSIIENWIIKNVWAKKSKVTTNESEGNLLRVLKTKFNVKKFSFLMFFLFACPLTLAK